MMITSATSASAVQSVSGQRPPPPPDGKGPFQAVSSVLGMSTEEISSAVASGSSLDDLASARGVSHDDLVAALKTGAPEELQGTSELDTMVEEIATRSGVSSPGGPGGPGGPPMPPPPASGVVSGHLTTRQSEMLDALSDLLGTSSDELSDSLAHGTSLADLLHDRGVTLDQVAGTLQAGFLIDVRA